MAETSLTGEIRICIVCAMVDESRQFLRVLPKFLPRSEISLNVVQTGIGPSSVQAKLEAALTSEPDALIVFGTAAGLDNSLKPGDAMLYAEVFNENNDKLTTSRTLTDYLATILMPLNPRRGVGVTVEKPVCSTRDKAALREATDSQCVDMETMVLARAAHKRGIPLAVLRVVVDPASQTIPSAALAGMGDNGRTKLVSSLIALLRNPSQLPNLLKLARQYRIALRTLHRAAELIVAEVNLRSTAELAAHLKH